MFTPKKWLTIRTGNILTVNPNQENNLCDIGWQNVDGNEANTRFKYYPQPHADASDKPQVGIWKTQVGIWKNQVGIWKTQRLELPNLLLELQNLTL